MYGLGAAALVPQNVLEEDAHHVGQARERAGVDETVEAPVPDGPPRGFQPVVGPRAIRRHGVSFVEPILVARAEEDSAAFAEKPEVRCASVFQGLSCSVSPWSRRRRTPSSRPVPTCPCSTPRR